MRAPIVVWSLAAPPVLRGRAAPPVIPIREAAKDLSRLPHWPPMRSYVYIMASHAPALYVGVTNDLRRRVHQHRTRFNPHSFTAQYRITQLVFYEEFGDIREAIAREKQIKSWRREKKIVLIESTNPGWQDLAVDWFRDGA